MSPAALLRGLAQVDASGLPTVERPSVRDIRRMSELLSAVIAQRMSGLSAELKRLYAPFDPDADRRRLKAKDEEEAEANFMALLDKVVDDANMDPLPRGG